MDSEFSIIGGGVVGLSLALGLLKLGRQVRIFDEGDLAFRASRGNFGLVWVQGKGLREPRYAMWSRQSAESWKQHARELADMSNVKLNLSQQGGLSFFTDEREMESTETAYCRLKSQLNGDYPFETLGHNALRKEEPNIGPKVVGAILHHEDGHVNPLKLLQALTTAVRRHGGKFSLNTSVKRIQPDGNAFRIDESNGRVSSAGRVVLSAGLGSRSLGPDLGFLTPIKAQQGQLLITEKLPPLIRRPSIVARQVDEGGVQIGASEADVGLDDSEDIQVTAKLANDALEIFPVLGQANIVRSWAALRIKAPDGLPIYQESKKYPGAFFVTCHSGITLSAIHTKLLPLWLIGHDDAPDLSTFSEDRFDVPAI